MTAVKVQAPTQLRCLDVGASGGAAAFMPGYFSKRPFFRLLGAGVINLEGIEPEPLARRAAQLSGDYQKVHPVAVADHRGAAPLYITREPHCSSLLVPDRTVLAAVDSGPGDLASMFDVLDIQEVTTTTLDELFPDKEFDLVKIDVQGAEHLVLAGAEALLENVLAIVLEVSEVPLYEGQLPGDELVKGLQDCGYTEITRNRKTHLLVESDVLLMRLDAIRDERSATRAYYIYVAFSMTHALPDQIRAFIDVQAVSEGISRRYRRRAPYRAYLAGRRLLARVWRRRKIVVPRSGRGQHGMEVREHGEA